MKIHIKVDLEKRDRLAIAHSQGLSIASTKEDCQAAISFAIVQYLQFVGTAYTKSIGKNEDPDQEKSNGQRTENRTGSER